MDADDTDTESIMEESMRDLLTTQGVVPHQLLTQQLLVPARLVLLVSYLVLLLYRHSDTAVVSGGKAHLG